MGLRLKSRDRIGEVYASALYRELDPGQLVRFFEGARDRRFSTGTLLHSPGDPSDRIYLVTKGRITLFTLAPNGRRLIKRHILPGSPFGIIGLLSGESHRNFAEVTANSVIRVATKQEVFASIHGNTELAGSLLKVLSGRVILLERLLDESSSNSLRSTVKMRLAAFLLLNADERTGVLDGVSQEEIADAIGAVRQSVAEAIGWMRRRGLVTTKQRMTNIVDRRGVQQLVDNA